MAEAEVHYKMAWKGNPDIVVNGKPLEDVLSQMENRVHQFVKSKPLGKPEWLETLEAKISKDGQYEHQIDSLQSTVSFLEDQLGEARKKIDEMSVEMQRKDSQSMSAQQIAKIACDRIGENIANAMQEQLSQMEERIIGIESLEERVTDIESLEERIAGIENRPVTVVAAPAPVVVVQRHPDEEAAKQIAELKKQMEAMMQPDEVATKQIAEMKAQMEAMQQPLTSDDEAKKQMEEMQKQMEAMSKQMQQAQEAAEQAMQKQKEEHSQLSEQHQAELQQQLQEQMQKQVERQVEQMQIVEESIKLQQQRQQEKPPSDLEQQQLEQMEQQMQEMQKQIESAKEAAEEAAKEAVAKQAAAEEAAKEAAKEAAARAAEEAPVLTTSSPSSQERPEASVTAAPAAPAVDNSTGDDAENAVTFELEAPSAGDQSQATPASAPAAAAAPEKSKKNKQSSKLKMMMGIKEKQSSKNWKNMIGDLEMDSIISEDTLKELQMAQTCSDLLQKEMVAMSEEWKAVKEHNFQMQKQLQHMAQEMAHNTEMDESRAELQKSKWMMEKDIFDSQLNAIKEEINLKIGIDNWQEGNDYNKQLVDQMGKEMGMKLIRAEKEMEKTISDGMQQLQMAQTKSSQTALSMCESLSETVRRSEEYLKRFEEEHQGTMKGASESVFKLQVVVDEHTVKLSSMGRRLDENDERLGAHDAAMKKQQETFGDALQKLQSSVGEDMNKRLAALQRDVAGITARVENELSVSFKRDIAETKAQLEQAIKDLMKQADKSSEFQDMIAVLQGQCETLDRKLVEERDLRRGIQESMETLESDVATIEMDTARELKKLGGEVEAVQANVEVSQKATTKLVEESRRMLSDMGDTQEEFMMAQERSASAVRGKVSELEEMLANNVQVIREAERRSLDNKEAIKNHKTEAKQRLMDTVAKINETLLENKEELMRLLEGRIAWNQAEIGKVEKNVGKKVDEMEDFVKLHSPFNRLKQPELDWQMHHISNLLAKEYIKFEKMEGAAHTASESAAGGNRKGKYTELREKLNDSCATAAQQLAELCIHKTEFNPLSQILVGDEVAGDRYELESHQRAHAGHHLSSVTRLLRVGLGKEGPTEDNLHMLVRDRWVGRMRRAVEMAMAKFSNSPADGGDTLLSKKKLKPVCLACNRAFDNGLAPNQEAEQGGQMLGGAEATQPVDPMAGYGHPATDTDKSKPMVTRGGFRMPKKEKRVKKQLGGPVDLQLGGAPAPTNKLQQSKSESAAMAMGSGDAYNVNMSFDVKLPKIKETTITVHAPPNR